jgi:hypothetical protein
MSTDERVQTFRERVPIVAKMVNSAFNGDAHQREHYVGFALIAAAPNGDCTMIGNLAVAEVMRLLLHIVAQEQHGRGEDIDADETPVGHA